VEIKKGVLTQMKMVNSGLLNQHFGQQPNSCVLSSYAIVSNYFNNEICITDIFDEYCNFFNVPYVTHLQSELHSGNHLNAICQQILNWRGYQLIDYMHNHSNSNLFTQNRGIFTAQIISLNPLTQIQFTDLVTRLRGNEAMSNILTIINGGNHSRTFGVNQNNALFIHDTDPNTNPKITLIAALTPATILECILYERI
jgi:hypothetical protein